ncbi:hypothetical protein CNR22_13250 [Sphingobacteriaceae bacterium]|nr:hypothetical protein CNR22_13250 [Sphingobacteriaceae bacterium]
MAFQVGDIKLSGTVYGISFYHSVFGWLARCKGGPSRKQFKTSPVFVRSRENSEEFTTCARAAAALRRLVIKHTAHRDKSLYHRLMKLMRLLADNDKDSLRGKRDPMKGMQTIEARALLKEFKISENLCLYDLLLIEGLIKKSHDKVKASKTPAIPSAAIKRRRTKKLSPFYPLPKALPAHLSLRQSQKQIQVNTAFG